MQVRIRGYKEYPHLRLVPEISRGGFSRQTIHQGTLSHLKYVFCHH